jgi:hypothetical protein
MRAISPIRLISSELITELIWFNKTDGDGSRVQTSVNPTALQRDRNLGGVYAPKFTTNSEDF